MRKLALVILTDILEKGKYNNIALNNALAGSNLSTPEKAFVTDLVNGTLRNLINLDFIINKFSKIPTGKMDSAVLNVLRLSAYQIFHTNTKPHALCNEGVNLIKTTKYKSAAPFVNGILRNILRSREKISYPQGLVGLSAKYSLPMWIAEYLSSFLEYGEVEAFAKGSLEIPRLAICINTLKTTPEDLKKLLKNEGAVLEGNYLSKTAHIGSLSCFKEGLFHVMGNSAIDAVKALNLHPNAIVYDICAAPGGKSFYAACLMENKGSIISADIRDSRIKLIEEGAKRLGISIIRTLKADALKGGLPENSADFCIADVPCSGLGTLAKKPDIKYTKSMDDIKAMAELQKKILNTASDYPKKGGYLMYSTCTVSIEENQNNTRWFAKNYPYALMSEKLTMPSSEADGFYYAIFRRL